MVHLSQDVGGPCMRISQTLLFLTLFILGGCKTKTETQATAAPQSRIATQVKTKPAPQKKTEGVLNPLAGKTMGQICRSDALLLSRFDIKLLFGTPLPKACCVQGVLPDSESHRCQLDWPSSDVPPCSLWQKLRQDLLAAHGLKASTKQLDQLPSVVRSNTRVLADWYTKKYGCGG